MPNKPTDRGDGYQKYRAADGCWRPPRPEGLARLLARAGYGARPRTTQIVQAGRVQIDGEVETDPGAAVSARSEVLLDGVKLCEAPRRYLVMNKPPGVECQIDGSGNRGLALLLPEDGVGLEVAGRMDPRSSGVLLLSNDLRWNRLVAESETLERVFHVLVRGQVTTLVLDMLRGGLTIPSQGTLRPSAVEVVQEQEARTMVAVTLRGDHARKVRAAFSSLRCDVKSVTLVAMGPVTLGSLVRGRLRDLDPDEQRQLLPPDVRGSR